MSYGIEIRNNSDRVIIDENYSNLYIVNETASSAAVGSSYPTTNYGTDLIIAAPVANQSGFISHSTSGGHYWSHNGSAASGTTYAYEVSCKPPTPSSGYLYYTLRKVNGNQTPPTSGYGFVVYDTSGTSAMFSATSSQKIATLVAAGKLSGAINKSTGYTEGSTGWSALISAMDSYGEPNAVAYYPSSTGTVTDLHKYFCVMSSATRLHSIVYFLGLEVDSVQGYEYVYTGTNTGRIRITNILKGNGGAVGTSSGTVDFYYYIYKVEG